MKLIVNYKDGDIIHDSKGKTWKYRDGVPDEKLDYDVNEGLENRERFYAYKMFRTKYNPENKRTWKEKGRLYPLYINASNYYEIGSWYKCGYGASRVLVDEFTNEPLYDKNGEMTVVTNEKGLSFRPGGHAGGLPLMRQRGRKDLPHKGDNDFDYFHSQEVFAVIEFSGHYDYTELSKEKQANSSNPNDPYEAGFTDINDINREGKGMGYYNFKTNTNAPDDEAWFIASAFRIVRVIDDNEMVDTIAKYNNEHGTSFEPQKRGTPNGKTGDKFNADFTQFGINQSNERIDRSFEKVNEISKNPLKGPSDLIDGVAKKILRKTMKRKIKSSVEHGDLELSELSKYMASFFFDMRNLHFNTTGNEFYSYHELCQDLYEHAEEYYDDLVETAINVGETVSPMNENLPSDWNKYDVTDCTVDATKSAIASELQIILEKIKSVKEGYDSFVYSKLDSMSEYFDKELYKIKQALKSSRGNKMDIANGWKGTLISSGNLAPEQEQQFSKLRKLAWVVTKGLKDGSMSFQEARGRVKNLLNCNDDYADGLLQSWLNDAHYDGEMPNELNSVELNNSMDEEHKRCQECCEDWEEYQESMAYPVAEENEEVIHSSKHSIKSAVDYGWEVKSDDAWDALQMFKDAYGEETTLEELARACGDDELRSDLEYIYQTWDIGDIDDFDSLWDAYSNAKEVLGTTELLNSLAKAMGYDELASNLAFIFRQYDFREWDSDEDEDDEVSDEDYIAEIQHRAEQHSVTLNEYDAMKVKDMYEERGGTFSTDFGMADIDDPDLFNDVVDEFVGDGSYDGWDEDNLQ